MPWGGRRQRTPLTFALLVALASCNSAEKRRGAEAQAKAEAEQEKQTQARADEFKRRDEEAAARHALQYPDVQTVENPLFEPRRNLLAKLAANPRSVKPRAVSDTPGDPDSKAYEYDVNGLGEIVQWRTSAEIWSMSVPSAPPEMFAPPGGLKHVVNIGPVSWWRVTSGPFDHGFVFQNGGGATMIRSMRDVCPASLAALTTECNRY